MMKIIDYEIIKVKASPKGNWLFIILKTNNGLEGFGEASQSGEEKQTEYLLKNEYLPSLIGLYPFEENIKFVQNAKKRRLGHRVQSFPETVVISAISQALWDLRAKHVNLPIYYYLGGNLRCKIPLYANINRALYDDRSPEAFAQMGVKASEKGFKAIKCAPFDGIEPFIERIEWRKKVNTGFERIAKLREAIGPDIELMVDCHGRFTVNDSIWLSNKLEQYNVYWLEDPIWSTQNIQDLRLLRRKVDIRLAGGERMRGIHDIFTILRDNLLDVIMPDVKYCGGLKSFLNIISTAQEFRIGIAPHNPSGPISTAISANICSTFENLVWLEYPFGEVSWRSNLILPESPIEEGYYLLSNKKNGLGINLNINYLKENSLTIENT